MLGSIAFYVVKAIGWIVLRIPESVSLTIAETIAYLFYLLDKRKKFAYANLKAAFGHEKSAGEMRRIIRGCYINLARTFVEVLLFPKVDENFLRDHVIDEDLNKAQALIVPFKGKGAVYVTAHLGNWELSQFVSHLQGFSIKVIARPQRNFAKLDDLLNQYRSLASTGAIQRGMGIRDAIRALRNGEILGFVQDQSGGANGTYVRFFGRLTSFPLGAFRLARHARVPVFAAFLLRRRRQQFTMAFQYTRVAGEEESKDQAALKDLEYYVKLVEQYVRKYPDQWLWIHRRWKYTKTKFITLLLDEKAGHAVQSRAILNLVKKTYLMQDPGNEIIVNEIQVRYKSILHRWLAHVLCFIFLPWLQGRLNLITWTLKKESAEAIRKAYADVVIATGSSVLPIHAAFARENIAKKIVIMKPSFPYSLLRYELALIPEHDRPTSVRQSFFVDLAPNMVDKALLTQAGEKLREEEHLPKGRYAAILLGGDTKEYELDIMKLDFAFREIRRVSEQAGAKILVTTSRRSSKALEDLVKKHFGKNPHCALLVIANEKNREGVVYGMMDMAEAIVVTEDSISMVSESIQSGKPALVLQAGRMPVRPKYGRFQQILRLKNYAAMVTSTEVGRELASVFQHQRPLSPCSDRERLTHQLAGAL